MSGWDTQFVWVEQIRMVVLVSLKTNRLVSVGQIGSVSFHWMGYQIALFMTSVGLLVLKTLVYIFIIFYNCISNVILYLYEPLHKNILIGHQLMQDVVK